MTSHGQRQFLGRNPAPIIYYSNHFQPALRDRNINSPSPRIDRILHQLLDHATRPLDNLAGGDFVDQGLGKKVDGHRGRKSGFAKVIRNHK